MKIEQEVSFTTYLKDDKDVMIAKFGGSIDTFGVPTISYYISDPELYANNIDLFVDRIKEFQDVVFSNSRERIAALKDAGNAEETPKKS